MKILTENYLEYLLDKNEHTASVSHNKEIKNRCREAIIQDKIELNGETYIVKYIAIMGFSYCKNLKKVVIPGTVNQLTRGTFLDCTKLEYVEIPASVKEFFPNCFGGCKSLKRMVFENLKESINNNSNFKFNEEAVWGSNPGVIIEDKATGKQYSLDEVVNGKI